jgi:hypothetical protein
VRVSDNVANVQVAMNHSTSLFGKVRGTSGVEWTDPNSQVGDGN